MTKINEKSDKIKSYTDRWKLIRDFIDGAYTVKQAGVEYLPLATANQPEAAYKLYKDEVTYYPATERTLAGLHGLVFARAPVLEAPKNVLKIAEAASYEGRSIYDIAEWAMRETLSITYGLMLVDYPSGIPPKSAAEAERRNFRPRISCYPAENVVRVETEYSEFHNAKILSYVEVIEDEKTNRVLKLVDGVYVMETWRGDDTAKVLVKSVTPLRRGETINELPVEILSDEAGEVHPRKPMLEDIALLNLDHYRCEGRISYIHYWQSMAILYATGAPEQKEEFVKDKDGVIVTDDRGQPVRVGGIGKIGGPDAWLFSEANAKVAYAEFGGEGVQSLERKLANIEERITKAGSQILASEKRGAEAAETVAMRRQAESSTIATTSGVVSRKITNLLQWCEWWEGVDEDKLTSRFTLNTDYRVTEMSPQTLTALAQDNQRGELSSESYFYIRQKGGVIPEALLWEEELKRREDDDLRVPSNDFPEDDVTDDEE